MYFYSELPTRVCLPMFTLAFPDVLFRFKADTPAFDVLFQFPPTWASTHPASRIALQ